MSRRGDELSVTEEDYVSAQIGYWTRVKRPSRFLIQNVTAVFFLLLGIYIFLTPALADRSSGWLLVVIGAFLFIDRYWLAAYRLRRLFRRSPNTSSARRILVTDEGMEIVMPNSSNKMKWAAVPECLRT